MWVIMLLAGIVVALVIMVGAFKLPAEAKYMRIPAAILALAVLVCAFIMGSMRHISADEVGIVVKNIGTASLKEGAYIAVDGEQGIQAEVLTPGWHFGYWPFIYDVREVQLTEVKAGEVGLLETTDGMPLEAGQLFAPEFKASELAQMLDARHFLTAGKGRKGAQSTVLTAGKYRLNTALFKVKIVPVTEVPASEVAVLKANFGKEPTIKAAMTMPSGGQEIGDVPLAGPDEMGVRAEVLHPGKYALNTDAYTVTEIWTTTMIAHFTSGTAGSSTYDKKNDRTVVTPATDEREITVRTSDGFTFPVDVRVEYVIEPKHAPVVVAKLGDDEGERFRNVMNSAVRAIFRNNAEKVKALDYVQQRSHQESQSLQMLATQMARYGVTVTAVRIGAVGDEQTLGALLKTQTDREIAKQEQLTFEEQQKTAMKQKELNKTKQEAEEERKLASAAYAAKMAEETAKQKVKEAEGEAKAIQIRAQAQAEAYELIAKQIGQDNAALIELLKVVGERGINITPRVLVNGGEAAGSDGELRALLSAMLERLISDEEARGSAPSVQPAARSNP